MPSSNMLANVGTSYGTITSSSRQGPHFGLCLRMGLFRQWLHEPFVVPASVRRFMARMFFATIYPS